MNKDEIIDILNKHLDDGYIGDEEVTVSQLIEGNTYLICFDGYKFGSDMGRQTFMSEMHKKLSEEHGIDALIVPVEAKVFDISGNSSNIEIVE